MLVERMRSWFNSLTKVETLMALSIVTISTLLLFRLPSVTHFRGIYFEESYQYLLITLLVLALVLIVRPPTIGYFGWPRIRWVGAIALIVAVVIVAISIHSGYLIKQPLRVKIAGVISILLIGFGEEMVSRVFVFGALQRFGTTFAVLVSSAMFGLMHINVYLPEWNGWYAYWHVMSTFSFGIFACVLFIATRSYWVVAIFHGLADWTVVFDKLNTTSDDYSPGIIEGVWWGVENFIYEFGLVGLLLLWIMRGRWPKWALHLAIKCKLVEQAEEMVQS